MPISFVRPEEAPVFFPSTDEFGDPLSYIESIAPVARRFGICKIHPPKDWKPPFCINQNQFAFFPRVQNLCDLSAYNRVKHDFITRLVTYWEAQDVKLFTPYIKGTTLDIFRLWKLVQSFGGFTKVSENHLWPNISSQLGYKNNCRVSSVICSKYKKILLPFEEFLRAENSKSVNLSTADQQSDKKQYSQKSGCLRRKLSVNAVVCSVCKRDENENQLLLCDGCETMGAHHTYCLEPPLSDVPKCKWFCPRCVARKFNNLRKCETFGFQYSRKRRVLSDFGNFADSFKTNHFGKPFNVVSLEEAETEFWRLMNAENTEVVVEYGTDLNTCDVGSGFPRGRCTNSRSETYVKNPWNLNNISVIKKSALRFLPESVSGMITPWCYVGMVFSCFCWHTEDHWSYSINYLHCGSPKTWYGVPTDSAEEFERAMRLEVPELFEAAPDLLHHITTMMCPTVLASHNVPVYRLDQAAGEFVVTFPRAYHAGFNQGFNFAEAVNFCPADWFTLGRQSIEHYAIHHRPPVFAHSELLCRMAQSEDLLSVEFLVVVRDQLKELLDSERTLRRHLTRLGVRRAERLVFESEDEQNRECKLCRTTLYLSALACKCSPAMTCLAHHQALNCCAHEDQVLRYRYGLDELSDFIDKLESQLQDYHRWQEVVNRAVKTESSTHETPRIELLDASPKMEAGESKTDPLTELPPQCCDDSDDSQKIAAVKTEDYVHPTISELKELAEVGRSRDYPVVEVKKLDAFIRTVDKCTAVVRDIVRSYQSATQSAEVKVEEPGVRSNPNTDSSTESLSTSYSSLSGDESLRETDPPNSTTLGSKRGSPANVKPSTRLQPKRKKVLSSEPPSLSLSKLSVEEFEGVVQASSDLKPYIPEFPELRKMEHDLLVWRERANHVINYLDSCGPLDEEGAPVYDLAALSVLTKFADVIMVDVPEKLRLKRIYDLLLLKELIDDALGRDRSNGTDSSSPVKPSIQYLEKLYSNADVINATTQTLHSRVRHLNRIDQIVMKSCSKLVEVLGDAKAHEEKLISLKNNENASFTLEDALAAVEKAESLPVHLPIVNEIRRMCWQAQSIDRQCEQIAKLLINAPSDRSQSPLDPRVFEGDLYEELALGTLECTSVRWKSVIDSLIEQERTLPIRCRQLQQVSNLINFVDDCRQRLCQMFLLPHTEAPLLELLLPRSSAALDLLLQCDGDPESSNHAPPSRTLTASTYAQVCKQNAEEFVQALVTCEDINHLYESLVNSFINSEVSRLRHLRSLNNRKSRMRRQHQMIYCVCRKPGLSGWMVQCEVCRDWFHGPCVLLPELKDYETDRLRYVCPRCERTARPELDKVLDLLEDLMNRSSLKLNIQNQSDCEPEELEVPKNRNSPKVTLTRLPEFVALQMLCDRAFCFVRRLRSVIVSNPELGQAIRQYERFAGVRLPLNGCTEETRPLSGQINPSADDGSPMPGPSNRSDVSREWSTSTQVQSRSRTATDDALSEHSSSSMGHIDERAAAELLAAMSNPRGFSTARKRRTELEHPIESPSPRDDRNSRDQSKTPRRFFDDPHRRSIASKRQEISPFLQVFRCKLSPESRKTLETLIFEASILEVSIPQTRWLWQLYLASDPDDENLGALHPFVARVEEKRIKRRYIRKLEHSSGPRKLFGCVKRSRAIPTVSPGQAKRDCPAPTDFPPFSSPDSDGAISLASMLSPGSSPRDVHREVNPRKEVNRITTYKQRNISKRPGQMRSRQQRRSDPTRISPYQRSPQLHGSARLSNEARRARGKRGIERTVQKRKPATLQKSIQKRAIPTKDRRGVHHSRLVPPVSLESPDTSSTTSSEKQRVAPPGPLRVPRRLNSTRDDTSDAEKSSPKSQDESSCSASPHCEHPTGVVNWIACDLCRRWYHQICVGIRTVPKYYLCSRCPITSNLLESRDKRGRRRSESSSLSPEHKAPKSRSKTTLSGVGRGASRAVPLDCDTSQSESQTAGHQEFRAKARRDSVSQDESIVSGSARMFQQFPKKALFQDFEVGSTATSDGSDTTNPQV